MTPPSFNDLKSFIEATDLHLAIKQSILREAEQTLAQVQKIEGTDNYDWLGPDGWFFVELDATLILLHDLGFPYNPNFNEKEAQDYDNQVIPVLKQYFDKHLNNFQWGLCTEDLCPLYQPQGIQPLWN